MTLVRGHFWPQLATMSSWVHDDECYNRLIGHRYEVEYEWRPALDCGMAPPGPRCGAPPATRETHTVRKDMLRISHGLVAQVRPSDVVELRLVKRLVVVWPDANYFSGPAMSQGSQVNRVSALTNAPIVPLVVDAVTGETLPRAWDCTSGYPPQWSPAGFCDFSVSLPTYR
jgi:hypothetical protein